MESCLGIISEKFIGENFAGLCKHRPAYMLPFAGRYRLIDFTISNMVNHNVRTVALYTGPKMRSAMDHLGNGKPWDLNRRINGLFLFPPPYESQTVGSINELTQFYSTMDFLNRIREKNVFIANPNILAKVDIKKAQKHFLETGADISLIYREAEDLEGKMMNYDKVHLDEDGNFVNLGENLGLETNFNHYLGMVFMKKEVFIEMVVRAMEKGKVDYLKESLINYRDKYKITTYKHEGHVEVIRNVKSFYDANLNLLDKDISRELFFQGGPILTKTKDEPSTIYTNDSLVENSLVANGCVIEGQVENSIIFRGVKIGKGAIIKNSIIMQKTEIEEDAIVVNTVTDKYTKIGKGVRITGSPHLPYVLEKYQKIRKE